MLVLKRKQGQWVDVIHARSGDVLRIRVCPIGLDDMPPINLVFDDDDRHFEIQRAERAPAASPKES